MKIGLITYDYPHLKSEQVIDGFLRRGYSLRVFGLPFVQRKTRDISFQHRPEQAQGTHPATICERHGLEYRRCDADQDIDSDCDIYHVLVGKILSAECLQGKKVLNCHPGVIPAVRGLDAFKWAVFNGQPLGVTLHYIDEAVDAGEIIAVLATSVYSDDTLDTLARRQYESEIDVIVDFERYLVSPRNDFPDIATGDAKMRMPRAKETVLLDNAQAYIERFGRA